MSAASDSRASSEPTSSAPPIDRRRTTLKLLAVDDESGMLEGIQRALEQWTAAVPDVEAEVAFEVVTADSGEAAVAAMDRAMPDLVLLDYMLPGMSGLDVLDRILARRAETLVIMITAYASIETAIAATKRGAYDFLPKPFTPADLRHTLRKAASRLILARRARALEEERKRIRFDFIRVLGHELKAPIAAVCGYLYLFRDHTLGDTLHAYDKPVARSLERLEQMRKLIVDLLDVTRLESGQKARALQSLDMAERVAAAVELATASARERNIVIAVQGPATATLRADQVEIDMILNNLLSNAIKYNKDGGRVDIELQAEPDGIRLRVSDTGIGMSPDETKRLFEEFVRIRNAKTKNILGSGLGLSIVKKLTDLYDGTVRVDSAPDRGTSFEIVLRSAPDAS